MESPGLFFREECCFRRRTNLKEAIASGSRLHPRNLFWESLDDLFDIVDHVDFDLTGGREIEVHTKVVMLMTTNNIELFIISVIPLSQPIQK